MNYRVAIASGKGGTGKTTLAVNLFNYFLNYYNEKVQLVDCDVEAPDTNIFIKGEFIKAEKVSIKIPEINTSMCTFCGNCVDSCQFNAILFLESIHQIQVLEELCHGCGACSYACDVEGAMIEKDHKVGIITTYKSGKNGELFEGKMDIGIYAPVPVIKDLKKKIKSDVLTLIDAPPGTSCPVIETIKDAEFVIIVAEPTPFGVHDMELMIDTVRSVRRSFGIVINKAGMGDDNIYKVIKMKNAELLLEIPFSRQFAEIYSKGEMLFEEDNDLFNRIEKFAGSLLSRALALK